MSQILTSTVGSNFEAEEPEKFDKGSFYLFENLEKYSKIPLLPGKQEIKLKHEDFECKFSYELKNDDNTQCGFISFLMFKIALNQKTYLNTFTQAYLLRTVCWNDSATEICEHLKLFQPIKNTSQFSWSAIL